MFKRAAETNPLPKPLTVEQILSDLTTFEFPTVQYVKQKRHISSIDPNNQKWWELFETFTQDMNHLRELKTTLGDTKAQLTERRDELREIIEKLEKEMQTQKNIIEKT